MKHIIIIGGGITSSYVASSLLEQRKYRITVLEANSIAAGASQNRFSSYRIAHSCPRITEMAFGALASYRDISPEFHDVIERDERGALYFFRAADLVKFQEVCIKYSHAEWPIELLDAEQGKKHFPEFNWQKDMFATYEPRAFAVNLEKFTHLRFKMLREKGVHVRENHQVTGFTYENQTVRGVLVGENMYEADHVVLASGAWTASILETLGLQCCIKSKQIQVNISKSNEYAKKLPIYFDSHSTGFGKGSPSGEHVYGFALPDWNEPVLYRHEQNQDQMNMAQDITQNLVPETGRNNVASAFRFQDGYFSGGKRDFYTPLNWQGLTVAAGWGGTGFKVAPTVGQRVANHILQIL